MQFQALRSSQHHLGPGTRLTMDAQTHLLWHSWRVRGKICISRERERAWKKLETAPVRDLNIQNFHKTRIWTIENSIQVQFKFDIDREHEWATTEKMMILEDTNETELLPTIATSGNRYVLVSKSFPKSLMWNLIKPTNGNPCTRNRGPSQPVGSLM